MSIVCFLLIAALIIIAKPSLTLLARINRLTSAYVAALNIVGSLNEST
jgi:hypothetical protein